MTEELGLARRVRLLDGVNARYVSELDPVEIGNLLAKEIRGDWSRVEYVTSLKSYSQWLVKLRRVPFDPLAALARPEARRIQLRHERRAITREEAMRLLAAAAARPVHEALTVRRGKNKGERVAHVRAAVLAQLELVGVERRLAYLTAMWTGLRRKELRLLQWRDVDFESGTVRLRHQTTKSRRADVIVMHPEIHAALRTWKPRDAAAHGSVFARIPSWRVLVAELRFAGIERVRRGGRRQALCRSSRTAQDLWKLDGRGRCCPVYSPGTDAPRRSAVDRRNLSRCRFPPGPPADRSDFTNRAGGGEYRS